MSPRPLLIALFLLISQAIFAQPANNTCGTAISIGNTNNWCSNPAQYTVQGASSTISPPPFCFVNSSHDVWFSFVATAINVNINIIGNTAVNTGGTLGRPEVALFSGSCGSLTELECRSDGINSHVAELYASGLSVGETYYIVVDGRNNDVGSFQLCINNFNPIPEPSGDCNTAVVLCDKSSFNVEALSGAGFNTNEITDGSPCGGNGCGYGEDNSAWYKWTCKDSGPLTFTLTPQNPSDDLDFWVYELPSGIDNCNNKTPLLCMASGEIVGEPLSEWVACTGATGAASGDSDTNENCGCDTGNNNFVRPLDMVAGRSYALIVMNFSGTGNGFSIEFGGSGTFQGPEAAFTSDPPNSVCWGESITFTDNSTSSISPVVGWTWNFGSGATPQTATGQGPHIVNYSTPGTKSITLTIENQAGCLITETSTIFVDPCCVPIDIDVVKQDLFCPDDNDGVIDLTVTGANPPYNYSWSNGASSEDINNLGVGTYTVQIVDGYGCQANASIEIEAPPSLDAGIDIIQPTCAGGTDGAITLTTTGGTPPYLYNWDNTGFSSNNGLTNLPISVHDVVIQDAVGCEQNYTIDVRELELELDPNVQVVVPPSCFGYSDGSITITLSNGQAPYLYDFNDGNGPVSSNLIQNIPAGTYNVDVTDANGCLGEFYGIIVTAPDPLGASLISVDVSCYGDTDGVATAMVTGGTVPYSYQWAPSISQNNFEISNLAPGNYTVDVTDANGCTITGGTTIGEPDPVTILGIVATDNECFGGAEGSLTVTATGGNAPYEYSADGINFQASPVLTDLAAGPYVVTVRDMFGCDFTGSASITEPFEIIVEARYDQEIALGCIAELQAVVNTADDHTYTWWPTETLSCTDCSTPVASPVVTTTYYVEIETDKGCMAMDSVTITVNAIRDIYIPNAFTPNYDGVNDVFLIFAGKAIGQIRRFDVYNRWGGQVFHAENIPANDLSYGWDGTFNGKRVNPGVFVYTAEVEYLDGVVEQFAGDVTVVE